MATALAVLETSEAFILEGPVDDQAYTGFRLFGGGIEEGEEPDEALLRELDEELLLHPDDDPVHLWSGTCSSENRRGELVTKDFSVFRVVVDSVADLDLQVPATIVEIPKAELAQYQDQLTQVAWHGLNLALASGYTGGGDGANHQ